MIPSWLVHGVSFRKISSSVGFRSRWLLDPQQRRPVCIIDAKMYCVMLQELCR